ncbi:uncharacterized protein LOC110848549 [Folsomia candida]|uniref:Uncharacterized protein n=1 Tax=Folsomia candida TaxID=158441 RepID=A0A226EFX4_FOLCA|nr:uncharacterized protein LOC110848549 [Folsomia candida]OXA55576.1 hypothetical protein Fcan01_09006 [Folsomia candida]
MPHSPKASTSRSSQQSVAKKKKNVAPPKSIVTIVPKEQFILQIDIPDDDDGMPEFPLFMFSIYPNFNYADEIVGLIHRNGGWVKVYDEKDDKTRKQFDCTIKLVNFKEIILNYDKHKMGLLPNDSFDFDFVRHYLANPGPHIKLEKYRLTGSDYDIKRGKCADDDVGKFDGDDVVWKRKNWDQLPRLRHPDARVPVPKIMTIYQACGKHNYTATSSEEDEVDNTEGAGVIANTAAAADSGAADLHPDSETDVALDNQDEDADSLPSGPPENAPSTASNDSYIVEEEVDDVEEESDESENSLPKSKSILPKKGKETLSFVTESYQPPLDKRNRVIRTARKRAGPPASGEWVDLGNQASPPPPPRQASPSPPPPPQVQVRGKRKDKTKRVLVSPPRDNSPGDRVMSSPSPTPTVAAPIRPCSKQSDNGNLIPVATSSTKATVAAPLRSKPCDTNTKKVARERSDSSSNSIPVATPSTSRQPPPPPRGQSSRGEEERSSRRRTRDSDINLECSDDQSSDYDVDADDNPTPPPRRAVMEQSANSARCNYAPRDLQAILDLVLLNKWGRYVKGIALWRFVEQHSLLERKIGYRTDQALWTTFKVKILPVLMGESNATTFRITDQQLRDFRADRAAAQLKQYGNAFPKNINIRNVKRV